MSISSFNIKVKRGSSPKPTIAPSKTPKADSMLEQLGYSKVYPLCNDRQTVYQTSRRRITYGGPYNGFIKQETTHWNSSEFTSDEILALAVFINEMQESSK